MYNVQEIENEEEFDAIILSAEDKLVAVDFSAEWCGPCKMIGPYFAQLSLQYTNVIFLKVDVDRVKPVAQKYGISAMPTFLFFKNAQKVFEFKGANTDQLNRALQTLTGGVTQKAPEPQKPASPYKNFPCTSYLYSDVAKIDMVLEKAVQFNSTIKDTNSQLALNDSEIVSLKKMGNTLKNVSMYHSSNFSMEEYAVVEKLLLWPPSQRFPGLDILRLAIMHPEASKYYASTGMINTILANLVEKDALYANILMCLRFLVNAFKFMNFRQNMLLWLPKVVSAVAPHLNIDKKDGKIALATVFLNYAVLITSEEDIVPKVTPNEVNLLVTPLLELLKKADKEEEEVNMRNIGALGTILYGHSQYRNQYISAVTSIPNSESSKFQEAKKELNLLVTDQVPSPKVTPSIPLRPVNTGTPSPAPMPNPWSGGGFGGMPNMPGFPTPNPDMMQRLATNPELMAAMQNPSLMNKLMEVARDPSKIAQYQSDPEFMQLLMKLNSIMQ